VIAAEILSSPVLTRSATQLAIIAHLGEVEDRIARGQDAEADTTSMRIREVLQIPKQRQYNALNHLRRDGLVVQGEGVRVRYGYSAPCNRLTPAGRELYQSLRRCVR